MQSRSSQSPHSSSPSTSLVSGNYTTLSSLYPHQQLPNYHLYSSHYAQAYMQSYQATTSDGYTLSSTYNTSSLANTSNSCLNTRNVSVCQPSAVAGQSFTSFSWYQPGNIRCGYTSCSFVGSAKSVEIHRMDRHLIYPSGWEKRKNRSEWDADPSLKGKKIPIQGTTIVLDSPEVLEAWISERRQRWPSSARVEEKKRKLQEAADRGQLSTEDISFHPAKRQKAANHGNSLPAYHSQRSRYSTRQSAPLTTKYPASSINHHPKTKDEPLINTVDENGSDEDSVPEVLSSKVVSEAVVVHPTLTNWSKRAHPVVSKISSLSCSSRQVMPKQQPRNPFSSRLTLLHNLLLPEIRVTISNLSQAIRFLVDNNFLDDIEITPGEADSKMIEVLKNQTLLVEREDGQ
ncbi:hypothetical protein BDQ17DRAFT_1340758 [Cyathus striatus]|nr:hypothetical protein BDQ17DRAFT_1340758 [Cyathus striatus]